MSNFNDDLSKFKPRKEQLDCLDFIEKEYEKNKENKFYLLNMPTGIGKSHMAMLIANFYLTKVNRGAKIDIITSGKLLQDQYSKTYDSINDLKGKDNYYCEQYSSSCSQGTEFNRLNKTKCELCPHSSAKDGFISGKISLTNFYLYILYALYMEKVLESRDSKVLIVDECLHPETEITLFDNSNKKIKDIKNGDLVKTINEETGIIENKPVVKLHHNLNKGVQMYEIEMDNGDILKITGNHKVKLLDGIWKKVEDLDGSENILFINKKLKSKIKSIKKIDYKKDVYNLHVQDNHNYFANNHCVSNCHEFDDVMSDFITIKITEGVVKRFKFANEENILRGLKKVKTINEYIEFLKKLQIEISTTISDVERSLVGQSRDPKMDRRSNRISKLFGSKNTDSKLMQIVTDLMQYKTKIDVFLKEYKENPNNWVLEKSYNEKTKGFELSLEPIWAYDYLDKYVFSNYDMVFLMSGTILDKNLFCQLNGLDSDRAVYYSIDSPFPIKNRPIYYMPLGKMSYLKKEETFKSYVPYINKILNKYSDKKGIIHTNSFELAGWISRDVSNPRLIFHDSSNKDEVLKEHFETSESTVVVSPSMDTGVSFDNDKARFQIIAKVPYPSLASQKNKLRQKNNPDWYSWKTVSGIIQMTGRAVRSNEDYADTIIIDSSFGDLLRHSGHLFPHWFQQAINKVKVKVT